MHNIKKFRLSPKRSMPKKNKENISLHTQNADISPPRRSLLDLGVQKKDPLESLRPLSEIQNYTVTPYATESSRRKASVSSSPEVSESKKESKLTDQDVGTLNKKKREEFRRIFGSSKKALPILRKRLAESTNATILPHREENRSSDSTVWHGGHPMGYISDEHNPWFPDISFEKIHDQKDIENETVDFPDDPFSDLKAQEGNCDKMENNDITSNQVTPLTVPSCVVEQSSDTTSLQSISPYGVKTGKSLSPHLVHEELLSTCENKYIGTAHVSREDSADINEKEVHKREAIYNMSVEVDDLNQRVQDFEKKNQESLDRVQISEEESEVLKVQTKSLEQELAKTREILNEKERNEEDNKNIIEASLLDKNNMETDYKGKDQQLKESIEQMKSECKAKISTVDEKKSDIKKLQTRTEKLELELAKARENIKEKEVVNSDQKKIIAEMLQTVDKFRAAKIKNQEMAGQLELFKMKEANMELESKQGSTVAIESKGKDNDSFKNLNKKDLDDTDILQEDVENTLEELSSNREVIKDQIDNNNRKFDKHKKKKKSKSKIIRLLRELNHKVCIRAAGIQTELNEQRKTFKLIQTDMVQKESALIEMKKALHSKQIMVIKLKNKVSELTKDEKEVMKTGHTGTKEASTCDVLDETISDSLVGQGEEIDSAEENIVSSPISERKVSKGNQEVTETLNYDTRSERMHPKKEINPYEVSFNTIEAEQSRNHAGGEAILNSSSKLVSSLYKGNAEVTNETSDNKAYNTIAEISTKPKVGGDTRGSVSKSRTEMKVVINGNKEKLEADSSDIDSTDALRSCSVGIEMPVGTTRARVAMATVQAMKSMGSLGIHAFLPQLESNVIQNINRARSQLHSKNVKVKELKESHNIEITQLKEKNADYARKLPLLQEQLFITQNYPTVSTNSIKHESNSAGDSTGNMGTCSNKNHCKSDSLITLSKTQIKCSLDQEKRVSIPYDKGKLIHENKLLLSRIKLLEKEVEDVSALLAETIGAVKGNEDQISSIDCDRAGGGMFGMFGRFSRRDSTTDTHFCTDSHADIMQLEKICRVHQFTVLKQREEIAAMRKTIEEKHSNINRMRQEAKANDEKISVLENQFIALNAEKDNVTITTSNSNDSLAGRGPSIIKVDAAYVESLELDVTKYLKIIKEQKNQLSEEKKRYDLMNRKVEITMDLHDKISNLTIKLQARDAIISALERSYKLHSTRKHQQQCKIIDHDIGDKSESIISQENSIENYAQIESQDPSVSKDPHFQISAMDKCKQNSANGKKVTILSHRRVLFFQEMFDVASRRLNVVINKLEENKSESMNEPFIFSVCEKYSLMRDYLKVSLHLLECKLSNELVSINDVKDTDDAVHARFDCTLNSLHESEKQFEVFLEDFKKDIDHQNIKILAKDEVIESLLRTDSDQKIKIKSLQSELNILKSLSDYSCVNVGVIEKFKHFAEVQEEMQEKDRIIQRLKNVIEDYRAHENISGDVCELAL